MHQSRWISVLTAGASLLVLSLSAARSSDRNDQERARAALQAGEILSLAEILSNVERRYLGRVIETELDHEDGKWVYEFKLLPPTGRLFKLEVDAATGRVLQSEGPVQERR